MMDVDVSDTPELSGGVEGGGWRGGGWRGGGGGGGGVEGGRGVEGGGGGGGWKGAGPQSVPSRISVVLVEETMAGGTPRLGCPCDDQRERQPARGTVSDNSLGLQSVEGTLSHSGITGLDVADAPALSGGGLQSVPSRISVVLVHGANAGGTPRRECPREDQDIRSLAGVTEPASVTVEDDGLGSLCVRGTLSSSDTVGRLLPVVPTGGSSPVGPIDPAGCCWWPHWPRWYVVPIHT